MKFAHRLLSVSLFVVALGACSSPINDMDALPDTGDATIDHTIDANPCGAGTLQCGSSCVAPMIDPSNCGSCGHACPSGNVCIAGQCTLQCPGGTVKCGTSCIDPTSSRQYCGASADCTGTHAGMTCPSGQYCVTGMCQVVCSSGQIVCSGACTDPMTSRTHCGASADCTGTHTGTMCGSGQVCVSGTCQSSCPTGQVACGGVCINPMTDPHYCGASGSCSGSSVGMTCTAGQACTSGTCTTVCPPGQIVCGGACVDPSSSRTYCGASMDCMGSNAGTMCGAGQICANGSCVASCPAGQIVCGNSCIDPTTDRTYCGASMDCMGANSGTSCTVGQICSGGTCVTSCPGGQIVCNGACVDPATNTMFCGASMDCAGPNAGVTCAAGQLCVSGTCQASCPMGQIACNGICIDPMTDRTYCGASMDCMAANAGTACGAGQLCVGGVCETSCPTGQIACGNACVDPTTDRTYCGASMDCMGPNAGTTCSAGQLCVNSMCQNFPCPTGQITCGGGCVDPLTNPTYCGASMDCQGANAGSACRFDYYCSAGTCWPTNGTRSYLSPGSANPVSQTRVRPTRYEIGTPYPATIYYTTDGSTPMQGAPGTMVAPNFVDLGVLNDGAHIRWYANFGGGIGPEPINDFTFHVDPNGSHNSGQLIEALRINGGNGPVIVAAPGATISGTMNYEFWHADGQGYCPGCVVYWSLNLDGTSQLDDCMGNFAQYPGTSGAGTFSFTVPTTPGRYAIRSNNALDFHCDPGGEEVGEVFVY